MWNSRTKAKIFEAYSLTTLYQETVGYWLIKLGFQYYYVVNNYCEVKGVYGQSRKLEKVTLGSTLCKLERPYAQGGSPLSSLTCAGSVFPSVIVMTVKAYQQPFLKSFPYSS